jgi:hypothetical protein
VSAVGRYYVRVFGDIVAPPRRVSQKIFVDQSMETFFKINLFS